MPTPTNPKLKTFFGNDLFYTMSLGSSPKISQPGLTRRVSLLRKHVSVNTNILLNESNHQLYCSEVTNPEYICKLMTSMKRLIKKQCYKNKRQRTMQSQIEESTPSYKRELEVNYNRYRHSNKLSLIKSTVWFIK